MHPQTVLDFWFTELTPKQHFAKDAVLDDTIRSRFGATLEAAARCELFAWRAKPEGRLAEILVLDQFSRNVYRDMPRALSCGTKPSSTVLAATRTAMPCWAASPHPRI